MNMKSLMIDIILSVSATAALVVVVFGMIRILV